jgi:hypothetical protein
LVLQAAWSFLVVAVLRGRVDLVEAEVVLVGPAVKVGAEAVGPR